MSEKRNWGSKLIKLIKNPISYCYVALVIMLLLFTKQIFDANGVGLFIPIAIGEVIISCLLIWILLIMQKKNKPIEKQFLLVALVLGALFIIILPPGQSPDEITHFRRAYGISQGILVPDQVVNDMGAIGSEIPKNTDFLERLPDHGTYGMVIEETFSGNDDLSTQSYTSAALYNFICYIPQALAAFIGNLFGFSIMGMAYLMEIFDFAIWVLLIYFAIKVIPKFKTIVLFIALLPITLQEATSISPDALTIGLCVFFISYVLYLAYGKRHLLDKKDYMVLIICSLLIGFCKIVYLPLILLLLIIPKEKFKSAKQRWLFIGILFTVVAIINMVWLMISSRYLIQYQEGVNSREQLMGIIKNPIRYIIVMFKTTNVYGQAWLSNMLGMSLGAFKFNLPSILFFTSFTIMILLFAQRNETLKLQRFDRWIFAIVFLMIAVLILTSLYLQWTTCGADVIDGVQGRYFLPILLLLAVVFCRKDSLKKYPTLISNEFLLYYGLFVNMVALVTIFAQNA